MKSVIILISFIFASAFSFGQEEKMDAHFLSFTVKYGLKKAGITQEIKVDIGSSQDHPYHGKINNIEDERVAIGNLSNVKVYTNELDLLSYLVNEGWEIIDIRTLTLLSHEYKQYLLEYKVNQ